MALGIMPVASVLIANAVLSAVVVLGVYKLMETNIALGAAGGLVIGLLVVVAEWKIGEAIFTISVSDMKLLVIVAAIGTAIGVISTMISVKPEI